MKRFLVWGILTAALLSACAKPSTDPQERARRLGARIRCPVCRGVSIADSPSSLAAEMMEVVRQQIASGKSDEEILKFFEERYGEWILLKPKAEGMNLVVWVLPAVVLIGGASGITMQLRKRKG